MKKKVCVEVLNQHSHRIVTQDSCVPKKLIPKSRNIVLDSTRAFPALRMRDKNVRLLMRMKRKKRKPYACKETRVTPEQKEIWHLIAIEIISMHKNTLIRNNYEMHYFPVIVCLSRRKF